MNHPVSASRIAFRAALRLLFWLGLMIHLWLPPALAESPLEPIDTSSPRATLRGFLEFMNKGSESGYGLLQSYLESNRLYLSPGDVASMGRSLHYLEAAERTLDLSALPPATAGESSRRLALQLKEILNRIELPPLESVPDAEAMAKAEYKRWTLPGTELRIVRMETGYRTGEYLFGPETVKRIPEFYTRVKELPDKPGNSPGFYEFAAYSPGGVALALHRVIPPRWVLAVPHWAKARFLDQPVWRWLGILAVLGAGLAVVALGFRLARDWTLRRPGVGAWAHLLRPLSVALAAFTAAPILSEILRISEPVYGVLTLSLWVVSYLALAWAVWVAGGALAENLIDIERLRISSIDSQLIRLVMRLVTVIAAVLILVAGADRIGLPAYSVVAGLGVGGLAVALAAQQTLANLLGSLIIMFEKPFAVGHAIKAQGIEGTVENVGFRSTRIRTPQNSLVTIPSSQLVNGNIDNMQLREYRQVETVLNLGNDTPPKKIKELIEDIEAILRDHPATRKDGLQVALNDIGTGGPDLLVNFFLAVPDRAAELAAKQSIFMAVLESAEAKGVKFR